jgi:hypothetical protein
MKTNTELPKIPKAIQETMDRQRAEDAAGARAAATPLPGPARDIWKPLPDIIVGPHRIRPFYDIDFEILQHLKHPLYEFMMSALHPKTGDSGEEDFMPVGQQGRELALLFTVTPDEAEAMMSQGTFSDEARARFRRYNAIQLIEITKAVSTQMALYWSPAVAYGPVKQGEGEGVQSDVHPPSSEPSTVLVG